MAVTRKTKSAGKSNPKAGVKSRKKKAKKPKVVLSTKKVAVFSACVCCFCAVFLGLSVVLNGNHGNLPQQKNEKVAAVSDKKAEKTFEKNEEKPKLQKKVENQTTKIVEPHGKISERNESLDLKSVSDSKSPDKKDSKSSVSSKSGVSKNAAQNQNSKNDSALKTAEIAKSAKNENVEKSYLSSGAENSKSLAGLNSPESLKSKSQNSASLSSSQKNAAAKNVSSAQKNSVSKNLSESSSAKNSSSVKKSSDLKSEKSSEKSSSGNLSSSSYAKSVKIEKSPQKIAVASNLNQNENAQNQALKNPRFDIPKAVNGATVVIVIDDAGRSVENVKRYANLPFPLTIAVLPQLAHSRECAQISRNLGKEVILHQPMQSVNHSLDPGPGKISVDMSFSEISSIIQKNLASLGPGVKGMNNHEGSEVTGDVLRIGAVLDACLENRIYFLDSRTTAQTKAPQAALERDMTIFEKAGPYIDNELSREKMLERLYETLRYANNHGHAIVIGHVDKSVNILPELLSEMYPYMRAAGYRFATPSTLR